MNKYTQSLGTTCSILMARGGTLGLAYGFIVGFIPGYFITFLFKGK